MIKDGAMVGSPVALPRLRVEFGLFNIVPPLVIAVLFPMNRMFPALFALTGMGILLLHWTPGFQWAELRYDWVNWSLREVVLFRPLFFHRYHAILPEGRAAYVLNAAIFSFAHLMYWSWIVALMTFAGGLLFTWAYRQRGSFCYAVLLHAIAGNIIFAVGLGVYFYSGNVQRPF